PMVLQRYVLALKVPGFVEALAERGGKGHVRRSGIDERDDRHRWLLRADRQRPRRCSAAEQRDELAPSYVGHGLLLALWRRPMRSVYHTPSLPRTGRQAMGDLNVLNQGVSGRYVAVAVVKGAGTELGRGLG